MATTRRILVSAMAIGALALSTAAFSPAFADPPKDGTPKEKHNDKDHKHDTKSAASARIGETAPDFTLTDTDGTSHTLSQLKGKIVVLEWFNPECPVIQDHHGAKYNTFNPLVESYKGKDVVFLAINSGKSADKDASAKAIKDWHMAYPVLLDGDAKVGKSYGAKTTPHIFIVDKDGTLAYKGAIDNRQEKEKTSDVNYAKQAIDELLAGKKVSTAETKAYGCGVKF